MLLGAPGEAWPRSGDRPLWPLCQILVSELPVAVPAPLDGVALLALFVDLADVPFKAPHGEGWELRTYASTDDLVPLVEPERDDELTLRPFPLLWRPRVELPSNDDIPPDLHELRWEFGDDGELFDLDGLKVGGWPRTVQAEVDWQLPGGRVTDAEFVFQVDSDEKARLNVVDGGVFYVGWSPTERWLLSCQFL